MALRFLICSVVSHSLVLRSHVASDPIEAAKVTDKGGFVSIVQGLARVNGSLAITRSIGDYNLAHYLEQTPDVLIFTIDQVRDMCGIWHDEDVSTNRTSCFMILGSDGLWETLSNDEAVHFVEDRLSSPSLADNPLQSISHELGTCLSVCLSPLPLLEHPQYICLPVCLPAENDFDSAKLPFFFCLFWFRRMCSFFLHLLFCLATEAYVRGSTDNIGVCIVDLTDLLLLLLRKDTTTTTSSMNT